MNDQYYTQQPSSESKPKKIKAEADALELEFYTDNGVFSKSELDEGTRILIESLPALSGSVLDLGCGWGAVGIFASKKYPEISITMADVNERALELARLNADANKVSAGIVKSDAFENIASSFDFIITNPPIRIGKKLIYDMFKAAAEHLNPNGTLVLVIRKQQGAESALKFLTAIYKTTQVLKKKKGYWIISCKA